MIIQSVLKLGLLLAHSAGVAHDQSNAVEPGRKIAVLVGISQYLTPQDPKKRGISSLNFAHDDAARLAETLKILGWEVTLLQSNPGSQLSKATKSEILGSIAGLKTNPEDTILFFFSGHGNRINDRDYLIPADGEWVNKSKLRDRPNWVADTKTLISYEDLKNVFDNVKALKRLLIVDACRDIPPPTKSAEEARQINLSKIGTVVDRSYSGPVSTAYIYSCQEGQKGWEPADLKSGIFTYSLINALKSEDVTDRNGEIRLELLFERTSKLVTAWARSNQTSMEPKYQSTLSLPIQIGNHKAIVESEREAARKKAEIEAEEARKRKEAEEALELERKRQAEEAAKAEKLRLQNEKIAQEKAALEQKLERERLKKEAEQEKERRKKEAAEEARKKRLEAQKAPTKTTVTAASRFVSRSRYSYGAAKLFKQFKAELRVSSLAFLNANELVIGGSDPRMKRWNIQSSKKPSEPFGGFSDAKFVATSADGRFIAGADDYAAIKVYTSSGSKLVSSFDNQKIKITGLSLSNNGAQLAVGSADGSSTLWEVSSKGVLTLVPHKSAVTSIDFSRNGSWLATGSDDQTVHLYARNTGKLRESIVIPRCGPIKSIGFSPSGGYLAVGDATGMVYVWDIPNRKLVNSFFAGGVLNSMVYTPDGNRLVTGSGTTNLVQVWDPTTGTNIAKFKGSDEWVWSVAVSTDGRYIASAWGDGMVRVWQAPKSK